MNNHNPQTTISNSEVTTNLSHDKTALTISFDGRQEQLPQPTKELKAGISALLFLGLSTAFLAALVTQILMALSLPIISFDRLLATVVGASMLGLGLHWSIRSRLHTQAALFCFSVVAGVVLGGL